MNNQMIRLDNEYIINIEHILSKASVPKQDMSINKTRNI